MGTAARKGREAGKERCRLGGRRSEHAADDAENRRPHICSRVRRRRVLRSSRSAISSPALHRAQFRRRNLPHAATTTVPATFALLSTRSLQPTSVRCTHHPQTRHCSSRSVLAFLLAITIIPVLPTSREQRSFWFRLLLR